MDTTANKNITKKKRRMPASTVLFILCGVTLPVIQWLVFYIYANFSSFGMAFTGSKGGFTFDNFIRFFNEFKNTDSTMSIAFRNTFLTFAINVISYPFKVLVSYFIYKKIPGAKIYRVLFFLPAILVSVCTAMMFSRVIGVNGFIAQWVGEKFNLGYTPELLADTSFANATVLLHMLWLGFPGDLIIWGGTFARIPTEMLEAATVDGTNWWTEFTRIVVPMVWPTVSLQMVLMACGIFSSSGAVFLLTGGGYGTQTISSWMYITMVNGSGGNFTSNVYNYLSAVGMCLSVVALVLSFGIRRITDRCFEEVEF